jgi:hypothetical protein
LQYIGEILEVQFVLSVNNAIEILLRRVYLDPLTKSGDVIDELLILELNPLQFKELSLFSIGELFVFLIVLLHFKGDLLDIHGGLSSLVLENLHILTP